MSLSIHDLPAQANSKRNWTRCEFCIQVTQQRLNKQTDVVAQSRPHAQISQRSLGSWCCGLYRISKLLKWCRTSVNYHSWKSKRLHLNTRIHLPSIVTSRVKTITNQLAFLRAYEKLKAWEFSTQSTYSTRFSIAMTTSARRHSGNNSACALTKRRQHIQSKRKSIDENKILSGQIPLNPESYLHSFRFSTAEFTQKTVAHLTLDLCIFLL